MKITEKIELNVWIADIETLKALSSFGFYNPDSEEWKIFEISEFKNDLYDFIDFYRVENIDRGVWYNGISFDCPVIEYIIRNYSDWADLNNLEIVTKIYNYAQKVIEDKNYGKFAEFKESDFSVPCFDVFTILGLNNEQRMTSLKKCEFNLDYPNVEELPINHNVETITRNEIDMVLSYMKNDILATYEVFKLTLGQTEHNLYKGNNQIELRYDIKEEFGLECLNYSDIKIGEELMIHSYINETGIERKDLPKKGTFRKEIKLKDCIPDYISFKTKQLQDLLTSVKKRIIKQDETISYNFNYYGTEYDLKNGGLHSKNEAQCFYSDKDFIIYTSDVGSFYPVSKIRRKIYPAHLGVKFLNTYEKRYNKRIELKPQSKIVKKIKGICDAIKLQLNIVFGKMGSKDSLFYDMKALLSVTIGNEFTLLKLIEDLELEGFHVFSANTDGYETLVRRDKEQRYLEICKEWEELTGYILEHDQYEWIKYSTVNDYIAKTISGKIKLKGDLLYDYELYKNKSWRIVALAVYEYFVNGKDPIEFICNHENIYDFCIMARATGQLYLEMQKEDDGSLRIEKLKKLVRYYLTTDKEWQMYKRGVGSTGKPTNINLHASNELGEIYVRYFNTFEQKNDYNIDYNQYIYKALKIISKIEANNKLKNFIESQKQSQQISLF